jgi:hypothetical protein
MNVMQLIVACGSLTDRSGHSPTGGALVTGPVEPVRAGTSGKGRPIMIPLCHVFPQEELRASNRRMSNLSWSIPRNPPPTLRAGSRDLGAISFYPVITFGP